MMATKITKPIVYGTIATWLGRKADEKKTHSWICYVRGVNNEDLSQYIDKVVFVLHNSFENPNREVNKHPFVISEIGWGQFEIVIKIYLKGDYDSPLTVAHMLKLYQTANVTTQLSRKPVVSEQYDEIVFINPKPDIQELLQNQIEEEQNVDEGQPIDTGKEVDLEAMTAVQQLRYLSSNFTVFDENESKTTLEKALQLVSQEFLLQQKRKNQQLDMEIQELQIEIENLQQKMPQQQL